MPRGDFTNTHKPFDDAQRAVQEAGQVMRYVASPEQLAIWQALLKGTRHVIVEAVAGSGKTFTIVEAAKQIDTKYSVGLVAFNKHIAEELRRKMPKLQYPHVECMTYHSLGFRALRMFKRGVDVQQYKVLDILDDMRLPGVRRSDEKTVKYRVKAMVGYCKSAGHKPDVDRDTLERIADRYDVDFEGYAEAVYELTPKVLQRCVDELGTVDYDDQVWLPMVLNLPVPRYDVLCVDEYQDTGFTQQWLAIQSARRLCAIGDPNQAIYAFRGADSRGFDRLREKLGQGVDTLPLTRTRRCPKSHVVFAQHIVPQIQALDDAPEGVVRVSPDVDTAVSEMRPGDLVVCRVNAELVGVAYKLLRRGVRALVRGRDLGEGLRRLVEDSVEDAAKSLGSTPDKVSVRDVVQFAGEETIKQVGKFNAMPNGRGEMRAMNAQDRYECLCTLASSAGSVRELQDTIAKLFETADGAGDQALQVTLGTVHRTKGLEGNRVFILRPELIPHPMCRKEEDKQGERNLAYVAVTRAKSEEGKPGELIFVGRVSPIFQDVADRLGIEGHHKANGQEPQWEDDGEGIETDSTLDELDEIAQEIADKTPEPDPDDNPVPLHRRWKN